MNFKKHFSLRLRSLMKLAALSFLELVKKLQYLLQLAHRSKDLRNEAKISLNLTPHTVTQ